ncbi:hypothetical protein PR202_ga12971 [Eleusine coracana subsp. coracana]|uniref:ATPase AAA-type core domain-containing protein n=1 Tax=Eleusine coracana subsp. coracana TaxID=191504 RepID=A0AAV5CD00_ELECO|nr:hypothetical protein PR202_ga12971 [Eleusine coracana subsp. coracana]
MRELAHRPSSAVPGSLSATCSPLRQGAHLLSLRGKRKRPHRGTPGRSRSTSSVGRLIQNGSDDDDDRGSPRRRHDAHGNNSSSSSLSFESAQPPPPPDFDITKTPKRNPGSKIEVTAEKSRILITSSNGEGGGDAKPEAPASEGVGGDNWPSFDDLGGMEKVIDQLILEVVVPLCHPELPRNLLGCCCTDHPVAGRPPLHMPLLKRVVYRSTKSQPQKSWVGCLIMLSLLKSIAPNLCYVQMEKKPGYVVVIGATNRPDAMDQALRRPGRFDREIYLGVPDENARKQILQMLTKKLRLEGQLDLFKIARATPGFVGADLKALTTQAGSLAEGSNKKGSAIIEKGRDFPSVPDVTWDDVGGLDSLRKEFERWIVRCIKKPDIYELLIELDGADQREGVYVIGATDRTKVIDDAVLRPGVDLDAMARREECNNLTGADLADLYSCVESQIGDLKTCKNGTNMLPSSGPDSPEKGSPTRCAPCRHPWVECSLLSAPVPSKKEESYLPTWQ